MKHDIEDGAEARTLAAENSRLKAEIESLNERVEALDSLAHQDSLVAMPNRRGFLRELDRLIAHADRYGEEAAMLFVDLDGLKSINDSFGHRAGDEALIQVASMLAAGVRKSDLVARIGGDEFGILLVKSDRARAEETAQRLGDTICNCEFRHDRQELPLSVAIGVTMIGKVDTAEDVMDRADAEMYRGKAAAVA
ncbi:MAG: GGDEF domain-containing protein [Pseudomonadota bacterium]